MSERPRMPAGYGISADPAGRLPWSWAVDRLAAARNYWVVTASPHGRPHAAPVWGLWLAESVVFSTDPSSRKGRNLAANPGAVIHLESGDDVVICEGTVAQLGPADDLLTGFVAEYEAKYAFRPDPAAEASGVYRMAPEVVLAWRESDFPTSATRWARVPGG